MNPETKIALALFAMLFVGLSLIAYGSGILGLKFSVGFTLLGFAVSWAALRLLDNFGGRR